MKLILISVVALFILPIASDHSDEFVRYYSSIDTVRLPVVFDCTKTPKLASMVRVDSALFEKFHPPMCNLVGRVFASDAFVSIVYLFPSDDGTPIWYTYTKDGRAIDTLDLYIGGCQADPGGWQHSFTTIMPDRSIRFVDSVFTVQPDSLGNPIPGSESAILRNALFRIDRHGHFHKKSASERRIF
jgi:hypothetical protein